MARTYKLHFDDCFDPVKIEKLSRLLPRTYAALDELAPWMKGKWPTRVHCMSDGDIVKGRKKGAGHGYTFHDGNEVWINPHMTQEGHWLVLVHEFLHHGFPDATEPEINCTLVPHVYKQVFGKKLDPAWARQHGIGSPVEGVGDRSFCR